MLHITLAFEGVNYGIGNIIVPGVASKGQKIISPDIAEITNKVQGNSSVRLQKAIDFKLIIKQFIHVQVPDTNNYNFHVSWSFCYTWQAGPYY